VRLTTAEDPSRNRAREILADRVTWPDPCPAEARYYRLCLYFFGEILARSVTFCDIAGPLFEPRRRGRRFGAHNEPKPADPVARSQRGALTLILRQDDRFDRSRRHRLRGAGSD